MQHLTMMKTCSRRRQPFHSVANPTSSRLRTLLARACLGENLLCLDLALMDLHAVRFILEATRLRHRALATRCRLVRAAASQALPERSRRLPIFVTHSQSLPPARTRFQLLPYLVSIATHTPHSRIPSAAVRHPLSPMLQLVATNESTTRGMAERAATNPVSREQHRLVI